jgi:Pyruvate/2-oxoacid:ferredoxin oxidoreductase gamma subunit
VSPESLEKAVAARVPAGTEDINLRVLRAGIEAAKKFDLDTLPELIMEEDE